MMIIDKLKLKRKIKKFNYLFIEKDNSFLDDSNTDLNRLLECIKSSNTILENFYKESRNRYTIHFQSYKSFYNNYNKDIFLEIIKIRIKNENDNRRKLFYDFLDKKITIDDSTYHCLCNVSKKFADSFFKAIEKPSLTVNNDSSLWFSVSRNDYILDILTYFEHHSYFKYNYTYDIRDLEKKLLGISSNYIVESWSSSIAYLCELEDIEEKSIFGSNVDIRKDIYDKVRKYLFRDASDKYFMPLEDAEYYSRRL